MFTKAADYLIRVFSLRYLENFQRYLHVKVHHQCQRHRGGSTTGVVDTDGKPSFANIFENFPNTGVVDIDSKIAAGVYAGAYFASGVNDAGGNLAAGFTDTGGQQ
jgi:hypothetical protein